MQLGMRLAKAMPDSHLVEKKYHLLAMSFDPHEPQCTWCTCALSYVAVLLHSCHTFGAEVSMLPAGCKNKSLAHRLCSHLLFLKPILKPKRNLVKLH